MGVWDRMKVMLGLADEYEEYEEYEGDETGADEPAGRVYRSPYGSAPSVRRVTREPDLERAREAAHLRAVDRKEGPSASVRAMSDHRRAASGPAGPAPQVTMHIAEPRAFTEAQSIADRFKSGTPVIMNLTAADPDLSRRLIDFASGLTYGLDGGLQKVSERVFMLTPANVDVSAADKRRLRDKGLFSAE